MPSTDRQPPADAQDEGATLFDLVATCLDRMEREGPAALEALCREHPAHAAGLRTRIGRLGAFGLAGEPAEHVPESLGEFKLLHRLGGGGMGVVYAAEQQGLQRRVALKLLRPGQGLFAGARERFRREVGVLARLQHPGIVPVFAGGEENGVPYLAMELVPGATLEEALAELQGRDVAALQGADLLDAVRAVVARRKDAARVAPPAAAELFAGNWVTTCVRLAHRLAEALEHAHAQGVLHRDVKPSNVMLTPDGRVLLLDFGLASSEGSVRLTGTGQPLGSPASMSPEQVRGDHAAVDARADVYALGLVLYEALTLHQPFVTDSFERTARLVLAARPPAPRARNPSVPRDAETVVLAAMEPDPARRYASAGDLARDLRNVLELRPIEARPPGTARRLLRWTQRRPALATACVLGALLLVAGPLGWELNRRRTLETVAGARDQAERNFQAALSAIGHVMRDMATEELEDVPRAQQARLVAIDRALELFPQLERDRPDDPVVLTERAELHSSRGQVLRDLGRPQEALPEFEREVALRRRLAQAGDDASRTEVLAAALDRLAKTHHALGHSELALPAFDESLALLRQACAARPEQAGWQGDLVLLLCNQAESQRDVGHIAEARASLGEALALAVAARQARPADAAIISREARVCDELYRLEYFLDVTSDAVTWARRSLESYEAAFAAEPGRRVLACDVATAHHEVAQALCSLDRFDEADAESRAGLAILEGLRRDYPDVLRYQDERSRLLDQLAISAGRRGLSDEARGHFETRAAELDEACRLAPDRRDLAAKCGEALSNLASCMIDAHERLDEALAIIDRAEARIAFASTGDLPLAVLQELGCMLRYNRVRVACFADRVDAAHELVERFDAAAGSEPLPLRYAADLWNEFVLCQRRVRAAAASAGGSAPPAASTEAEAVARARMYTLLAAALDAGYDDRHELETTLSLDDFRGDPEFRALMERLPPVP